MSEHWKSTVSRHDVLVSDAANLLQPKYWCKHCKAFVKDTKLEKTNHEATPRHQGNLQRFLRQLYHGQEREEREKQRAKEEVDRLNGITPGSKTGGDVSARQSAIPQSGPSSRLATPAERKKQLQQLAEMGVAVPEDFRREMAMAGDWQTTSRRVIYEATPQRDGVKKAEDDEDAKSVSLNVGVRKRKHEGQEEEEEAVEKAVKKGWGSTTRAFPGLSGEEDDLDALLQSTSQTARIDDTIAPFVPLVSVPGVTAEDGSKIEQDNVDRSLDAHSIKTEEPMSMPTMADVTCAQSVGMTPEIKQEEGAPDAGIIFKKRKPKSVRHI